MKYLIACILFACSCVSKNTGQSMSMYKDQPFIGIYTTYVPNYIQRVKIEKTYNGRLDPLPIVLINLRNDGTYVLGYCDNQISEAGKYKVVGDSIGLYDRHNFDERMYQKLTHFRYDKDADELFVVIVSSDDNETKLHRLIMGKTPNNVISMKRKATAHLGFMRGQDMAYDSIINNYEQRPLEEQQRWSDSVINSAHIATK